jgi:DNA-binding transcriptional MocR family regulator
MNNFEFIRAVRDDDSLSPHAKLTAIVIGSHYNWITNDPCWASNKTLAKETGLSARTVIRAKRELEQAGYLVSHRQWDSANLSHVLCPTGRLKDTLKDTLKDKKKDSNESLVINNINVQPEDILVLEEQSSAAARIMEEDWLSW